MEIREKNVTDEALKKLPERAQEALLLGAVADEIAKADGWDSLDGCGAALADKYFLFAEAALRAMRRV